MCQATGSRRSSRQLKNYCARRFLASDARRTPCTRPLLGQKSTRSLRFSTACWAARHGLQGPRSPDYSFFGMSAASSKVFHEFAFGEMPCMNQAFCDVFIAFYFFIFLAAGIGICILPNRKAPINLVER